MDSEGDTSLAVTWWADHSLIDMLIPPVPAYTACLTELAIYNNSKNCMDRIIDNLISPLEDLLTNADVDLTWPRQWNGCKVSKLQLGFGDIVHVWSDVWDAWGLTIQDLTLGCECSWDTCWDHIQMHSKVTGYEDNYPLCIEGFFNLEALCFKVNLDSKSTQWIFVTIYSLFLI